MKYLQDFDSVRINFGSNFESTKFFKSELQPESNLSQSLVAILGSNVTQLYRSRREMLFHWMIFDWHQE